MWDAENWRAYFLWCMYDTMTAIPSAVGSFVNSVQNGLLLRSDIHQLFDGCALFFNQPRRIKCDWASTAGGRFKIITRSSRKGKILDPRSSSRIRFCVVLYFSLLFLWRPFNII